MTRLNAVAFTIEIKIAMNKNRNNPLTRINGLFEEQSLCNKYLPNKGSRVITQAMIPAKIVAFIELDGLWDRKNIAWDRKAPIQMPGQKRAPNQSIVIKAIPDAGQTEEILLCLQENSNPIWVR
jgi:hypothetical protein